MKQQNIKTFRDDCKLVDRNCPEYGMCPVYGKLTLSLLFWEKAGCPCIRLIYYIYVQFNDRVSQQTTDTCSVHGTFILFGDYRPTPGSFTHMEISTRYIISHISMFCR